MLKPKVIDIISPKEIEKKAVEEIKQEEKEKIEIRGESEKTAAPRVKIPSRGFNKKTLVFGAITGILVFVFVLATFFLAKADIQIWPKTENISFQTKLTVDKTANEANFVTKVIRGEIFESEKTTTETFPATGKTQKEAKAEGFVTVYNNYSTVPQIFIANTRFVSSGGKTFRTPVKITVPGGTYEGAKLVPGEIEIKVVADKAGPDYNINPATFSVPGLAGTEKYTKFYAKSFQSFTGGFFEESPQITKDDLENAKNTLTKKAKEESESSFKELLQSQKIPAGFTYLEKTIQTEIIETFSLAREGDLAENFNYQVKAKSKTLIFLKDDLTQFSQEFLAGQVGEGEKLYAESLKTDFSAETVNLETGKIVLSLIVSGKTYPDINLSDLKNNLKGKSLAETKLLLANQADIVKTQVEFWPFWSRKVPANPNKINLEIKID